MDGELDAIKVDTRELVWKRLYGVAARVTTGVTTCRYWRAREKMLTDEAMQASLARARPRPTRASRGIAQVVACRRERIDLPPEVRRIASELTNREVRITMHKADHLAGISQYHN